MPFTAFPLAYMAGKSIDAPDHRRNLWDNWINAKQISALLHVPEARVFRFAGKMLIPTATVHEPSGRLLWWPGDILAALKRIPTNQVPQWLDEPTVARWLSLTIERLQQLVTAKLLPEPTRHWRGTRFWRPADVREAVAAAPNGFACTFAS